MTGVERKRYEFGKFTVDAAERLLFENEKAIQLSPKVFDTLLFLVENRGRSLGKEEILNNVWAGSFVEENNLQQHISLLRKIFGEANFIETVPKRGYRFVAPLRARRENGALNGQNPAQTLIQKPKTHYAQNGDVNIAYQVIGEGDFDIVFVMGWISHLEYFWEEPRFAAFLNRLASFSRLILFDKRGTGLSDRVPINELPTLEQRMEDVHAVMNAVGSERAALIGVSEGGPMCSLFAATYPERTLALIMIGTYAKRIRAADYPWAPTADEREKFIEYLRENWGKCVGIEERAPSMRNDKKFRNWWATYLRMGASPGAAVALTKMNAEIDVRNVLPSIQVPTLVIHRKDDACLKVEEGRFVAAKIAGAKFVELAGDDHLPFVGKQDEILDEAEEFLTGVRQGAEYDRVLATVLIIRVCEAGNHVAEFGADGWLEILKRAHQFARNQIKLCKGREIEFNEKGLMATFDGPAKAVRCAQAITNSARRLKVKIKAGLHTGECDIVGEKIGGVAVSLAEQVAKEAKTGEILVSRTIKDLVAGSGLEFAEKGTKEFPNLPGEWQLFTVEN